MIQAKCIQKFRNKSGKLIGYRLQDINGQTQDVTSNNLKKAIINNQISVINLTLTSDNRLIDTVKNTAQPQQKPQQNQQLTQTQSFLNKAKFLGFNVQEIPTVCGHNVCLASKDQDHILFIPPEVTAINQDYENMSKKYIAIIKEIEGRLKVIGGQNLTNTSYMFYECQVQNLDLSNFNTSKVTNMRYMFGYCEAKTLDLSSFDTSNVTDMYDMFDSCEAKVKATDQKILKKL